MQVDAIVEDCRAISNHMKPVSPLPAQLRALWPVIGLILFVSATFIGIALLLHAWKGVPVHELTMDPSAIMDGPPYLGFFSQVGILLWAATAAICILAATLVSQSGGGRVDAQFLYASGMLTIVLGIDDAFMLHEYVFPALGIAQELVLLAYGIFVLVYLFKFRQKILRTQYILLAMAFFFFALSIAGDQHLIALPGVDSYLLEDGAKLAGIISWLAYFSRTAVAAVLCRGSQTGRTLPPAATG